MTPVSPYAYDVAKVAEDLSEVKEKEQEATEPCVEVAGSLQPGQNEIGECSISSLFSLFSFLVCPNFLASELSHPVYWKYYI